MDKKSCECCSQEAKIICFCRKVLLCERCIGKHLVDEPSLSHKPLTISQSEMSGMYEEHLHSIRVTEDLLLGEVRRRQDHTSAVKVKLSEGINKLKLECN